MGGGSTIKLLYFPNNYNCVLLGLKGSQGNKDIWDNDDDESAKFFLDR